jgi:hypothetical protein
MIRNPDISPKRPLAQFEDVHGIEHTLRKLRLLNGKKPSKISACLF